MKEYQPENLLNKIDTQYDFFIDCPNKTYGIQERNTFNTGIPIDEYKGHKITFEIPLLTKYGYKDFIDKVMPYINSIIASYSDENLFIDRDAIYDEQLLNPAMHIIENEIGCIDEYEIIKLWEGDEWFYDSKQEIIEYHKKGESAEEILQHFDANDYNVIVLNKIEAIEEIIEEYENGNQKSDSNLF